MFLLSFIKQSIKAADLALVNFNNFFFILINMGLYGSENYM